MVIVIHKPFLDEVASTGKPIFLMNVISPDVFELKLLKQVKPLSEIFKHFLCGAGLLLL